MTDIYLHIVARMADYMATHPYIPYCSDMISTYVSFVMQIKEYNEWHDNACMHACMYVCTYAAEYNACRRRRVDF